MRLARWGASTSLVCVLTVLLVMSCKTTPSQDLMSLSGPMVPGAEYVGMEMCAECHADQAQRYRLTSHFGTSVAEGEEFLGEACESCHGAGSLHVEGQGDPTKIVRSSEERCFVCHMDVRARFQLQYHHPVPEGHLSCSNCHDPHGRDANAWSALSELRPGEKCFQCHKEFKGPFLFEHDPVRDGCQTCHNPHGSPYDKLLVADQRVTCLRCHWEPATNSAGATIGGRNHSGWAVGRGTDCIDHHSAVHGSNLESSLLE